MTDREDGAISFMNTIGGVEAAVSNISALVNEKHRKLNQDDVRRVFGYISGRFEHQNIDNLGYFVQYMIGNLEQIAASCPPDRSPEKAERIRAAIETAERYKGLVEDAKREYDHIATMCWALVTPSGERGAPLSQFMHPDCIKGKYMQQKHKADPEGAALSYIQAQATIFRQTAYNLANRAPDMVQKVNSIMRDERGN